MTVSDRRRVTDELRILSLARSTRTDALLALSGPLVAVVVIALGWALGPVPGPVAATGVGSAAVLGALFTAGYSYHCLVSGLPYPTAYGEQRRRVVALFRAEPHLLGRAPASSVLADLISAGGHLTDEDVERYRERVRTTCSAVRRATGGEGATSGVVDAVCGG